jgi:hypothetical protein
MEGFYLVLTAPHQDVEREYHRWYEYCHLPDIMDVPDVCFARRFALTLQAAGAQPLPRFAAVYGLCDVAAAIAEIVARRGTEKLRSSDTVNRSLTLSACFEAPLEALRVILSGATIGLSLLERECPSAQLKTTINAGSSPTAAVYAPASAIQTGGQPLACRAIELKGSEVQRGEVQIGPCSIATGAEVVWATAIGQLLSKN